MKFLLDTNTEVAIFRSEPGVLKRLPQHRVEDIAVSSMTTHELYFGAYKSQKTKLNLTRIANLAFQIVEFDNEFAQSAGEIRANLAQCVTPIGPYDTMIAGQAVVRNLTLITHNTREFRRVSGLHLEDWES